MKQKINCRHPKSGDRVIGILDTDSKKVLLAKGIKYCLSYLKKVDKNGIGFFGTYSKGKKIQESGEYKQ